MSMMYDGMESLTEALQEFDSESVEYRRGGNIISGLKATRRITEWEVEDFHGAKITGRTQDWIIKVSDLKISGSLTEPKRGDLIKATLHGVQRTFTVQTPFGNNCYKLVDHEFAFRIHTDFIGGVTIPTP